MHNSSVTPRMPHNYTLASDRPGRWHKPYVMNRKSVGSVMKGATIASVFLTIASFTNFVSANQECITGLTKMDMCEKARQLSNEIATMLPMKMSQNMSWESVAASGKTIQAHIRLSYDKKYLEETYKKAGLPLPRAKQAIQKSAASICQQDAPTRAFISLGGSFKYIYSFVDGEQFTTAVVSSCE